MMVHFRKRFSEEDLNRINELIAERGKAKETLENQSHPRGKSRVSADAD
jgi:hypothetical protein